MVDPTYRQYSCLQSNPLGCRQLQQGNSRDPGAKYCATCNFPSLLNLKAEIQGNRGVYEVDQFLGTRGAGRLYQGWLLPDRNPIVIREYLLPTRTFNAQETRQRRQLFAQMSTLKLSDGRVQDFRLLMPDEAISDRQEERCYLITAGNLNALPTLRSHLQHQGAMTGNQIRRVLHQVLQTLEFLHSQKFSLPNGQLKQGMTHSNLSLDTLLLRQKETEQLASSTTQSRFTDENFLIYLCDLALWENLFHSPTESFQDATVLQELVALGQVGFYLLVGSDRDPEGEALYPKDGKYWAGVSPAFKDFLLSLMGLEQPFVSAEAARQALLRLPPEPSTAIGSLPVQVKRGEKRPKLPFPWRKLLLLLLTIPLLGLLFWWLSTVLRPKATARSSTLLCCAQEVTGVPKGKFIYTGVEKSTWSIVLEQKNLVERGKRLDNALQELQPELELRYRPQVSIQQAFEQVRSGRVEFLVTGLAEQAAIDLKAEPFAYDGLVVFVAFSYSQRDRGLPRFLSGQITFEQLRRLYTGEVQNWRDLGGPDLPVKLYIPPEIEAISVFEERVLQSEDRIRRFRELQNRLIATQPTFDTLRQVIRDFEQDQVGSIAFGTLSQVFGQCSVYPLALIRDRDSNPEQALIENSGEPISPMTDLCDAKGSYDRNVEAFQTNRYPLAYPLAVVYLRDNRRLPVGHKFAEILQTLEAQKLLSQTGLVPLQPLPKN
ncbi:hypothetical protein BST81_13155 [Leptolyngbya sp. 'hensonii']|uniref:substrate-binding domain-containing protein n=1 Tax=Leptolyngbya sp. 'hensonii' TaxID=1922337 RepID=UPI00095006D4|nr:substrate-binding domain-containing protein [Leptolyngbya sp. 'hensonii']OLP17987.1 hypothetical protein BST81_13155 [Leptolyngbya sp. 'hensonii']